MISTKEELFKKLIEWAEKKIPEKRLTSDVSGRDWFLKTLGHKDDLKLASLKNLTNRKDLISQCTSRQRNRDTKSKKGISALKMEISALYSFNKCAVARYKGRMHYYRDDLSQKAARNTHCMGQAVGLFQQFKEYLDS